MLRIVKILLVASVAAWAALGALGNLLDWQGTTGVIGAVTSMATFAGGPERWRATANPVVILGAAALIVLFKLMTLALCAAGAWRMWGARKSEAAAFDSAKALALTGCAVAVLGLFVGWIVIGEQWFEYWRSDAMREAAGGSALRYGVFIALIALIVGARDE
jgi:predicted small integral membrane protein